MTLGQRVKAAIDASGKSRKHIWEEAGTDKSSLSRIESGANPNPGSQLLLRIAQAAGVPVGSLYGDTVRFSATDEEALLHFRGWIDEKLATIDARKEPNAIVLSTIRAVAPARQTDRVADRPKAPKEDPRYKIPDAFRVDGDQLVVRATGDSMVGAGILGNDTLYTAPVTAARPAVGAIVVCSMAGSTFVKRLVSEHRRLFLLSAHPRYAPIEIDKDGDPFEILGIVIGRAGAIE